MVALEAGGMIVLEAGLDQVGILIGIVKVV